MRLRHRRGDGRLTDRQVLVDCRIDIYIERDRSMRGYIFFAHAIRYAVNDCILHSTMPCTHYTYCCTGYCLLCKTYEVK